MTEQKVQIVIVGGGAGGLELATKLGRKYRKSPAVSVLLLDKHPFHIWKPLLHEIASGSMNAETEGLDYRLHAANNGFEFQRGCLTHIDRDEQQVSLEAIYDDKGDLLVPCRSISYDVLVIAVGSITNDFGIPGVRENCFSLDDTAKANEFHTKVINEFLKIKALKRKDALKVAVIGAGATGVELTAELYQLAESLKTYGFSNVDRSSLQVDIFEASDRILGALPERISNKAATILEKLGAKIRVKTMVEAIEPGGLHIKGEPFVEADLLVWCAGVKCRDFLCEIGGLETNRANQLVVDKYLRTSSDPNIYAVGDCAAFSQEDGSLVPPRAQSAHQMADAVAKNIIRSLRGKPLVEFRYKDHGSLVSFAEYSSVGVIQGLMGDKVFVEGSIAKRLYISLYRLHQIALYGYVRTGLLVLVGQINRRLRPKLKLH